MWKMEQRAGQANPFSSYVEMPRPSPVVAPPVAPPVVNVVPVSFCPVCKAGLIFDPPRSQSAHRVQCPRCMTISAFQLCWTCPQVIPYDSVCAACFSRDAGLHITPSSDPLRPQSTSPRPSSTSPPPTSSPPPSSSSSSFLYGTPPQEKGLSNRAGENNCFLNVTIQSLWHLEPFRNAFESTVTRHAPDCNCVHCALTIVLTNYRYAASQTIAPNVLRKSMDVLYAAESRFQIGDLSDATECFDAICSCLHDVAVGGKGEGTVCDPQCCAHSAFGMIVEDVLKCKRCGDVECDTQSMFLHYVYASEIIRRFNSVSLRSSKKSLERILKKLNAVEPRGCPKCGAAGPFPVQKTLLKPWPRVFAICIAWADPNPPVTDVATLLAAIDPEIDIGKIFDAPKESKNPSKRYKLRGLISYYLQHYAAYFFSDKDALWYSFDDVSVQAVGPSWKDVMQKCRKGHAKPVLVFFEETLSSAEDKESSPIVNRPKHKSFFGRRND